MKKHHDIHKVTLISRLRGIFTPGIRKNFKLGTKVGLSKKGGWGQDSLPDRIHRLVAEILQKTGGRNITGVEFCLALTCMLVHGAVITTEWTRVEGVDQFEKEDDCVKEDVRRWHTHISLASVDCTAAWTCLLSLGPTDMAMNELNAIWQQGNADTVQLRSLCTLAPGATFPGVKEVIERKILRNMIPQRIRPDIVKDHPIYGTFGEITQHADAYAARVELRIDQGTQWTAIDLQECQKSMTKNQKRAGQKIDDYEIRTSAIKGGLQKGERIFAMAVLWKM